MLSYKSSFAVAVLALGLMVGSSAGAASILTSSSAAPNTLGTQTITFTVDVTGAVGGVAGVALYLTATGGVTFTGLATCVVGDCTPSTNPTFPNQGPASFVFSTISPQGSNFILGTIQVNVAGTGTVSVAASPASVITDNDLTDFAVNPGPLFSANIPVPEPGTLLLLGSGLAGLALLGRRRN